MEKKIEIDYQDWVEVIRIVGVQIGVIDGISDLIMSKERREFIQENNNKRYAQIREIMKKVG